MTFSQENDCCDDGTLGQLISISSAGGGGGKYFIIKTDRWAFESVEELTGLINDAIRRLV